MAVLTFPTSKDIYIEVNGKKLAVAQSYKVKTTKESRYVEAFGSKEPVGTIDGRVKHFIELTRVRVDDALADSVDFHSLSGFNLVIVGPKRKVIFSDCQWSGIFEATTLGDVMFETVSIVAGKRIEVAL